MIRILCAVAVLMMALPVAHAQQVIEVKLGGIEQGQVVSGVVNLHAEASSAAGVKRLSLLLGEALLTRKEPKNVEQTVEVDHAWDTSVVSSGAAHNGEYTITAAAVAHGDMKDQRSVRVLVNNPPAQPSGMTAEVDSGVVSLSWMPASEPDLLHYIVERDSGEGFAALAQGTSTQFSDAPGRGSHSYRVIAVRSSPITSDGIASIASEATAITLTSGTSEQEISAGAATIRGNTKRGFVTRSGERLAGGGLPSGAVLPGGIALPELPAVPVAAQPWGSHQMRLPYRAGTAVGYPRSLETSGFVTASSSVLPADGLRWVAAGLLALVVALALHLTARRIGAGPL